MSQKGDMIKFHIEGTEISGGAIQNVVATATCGSQDLCTAALTVEDKISRNGTIVTSCTVLSVQVALCCRHKLHCAVGTSCTVLLGQVALCCRYKLHFAVGTSCTVLSVHVALSSTKRSVTYHCRKMLNKHSGCGAAYLFC
jgi:hypothetical protein